MEAASLRFSIYLIAEGLQAHRDSTGSLPATLKEIGLDDEGIEYLSDGSTYRLVAVADSTSIVYQEGSKRVHYASAYKVLEGGAVQ
jgi:hypothetical protein